MNPVLLMAGCAQPRWLLDWDRSTYDEGIERLEGLQLVRDKQLAVEGYLGSLNEMPGLAAPVGSGSSYLFSKKTLNVLEFTEFEKEIFVRAEPRPS